MALDFVAASSELIYALSTPITAAPFTMSCWFTCDDNTTNYGLMFIGDLGADSEHFGFYRGTDAKLYGIGWSTAAGQQQSITTTTTSVGVWHHACFIAASTTSRNIYLDGGGVGSNTVSCTPLSLDHIAFGCRWRATIDLYLNGKMAEIAMWNTNIDSGELNALSKGFSPRLIKPNNLVVYQPIIRGVNESKIGTNLTTGGTPDIATHVPKMIYPIG